MTTVRGSTTVIDGGHRDGCGFAAAAAAYIVVFAAGATPIPLYGLYRTAHEVTDAELSLAAVAYFVSAVSALLVLGRLSDHLGRKPVALSAIALAIAGAGALSTVHAFPALVIGRAAQGVAAGLAASSIAAFAVDSAPIRPRWLISTLTAAGTNVGLAIGAFGTGALVQAAVAPRQLSYGVAATALLLAGTALALAPETVRRAPGAAASLVPRIALPVATRRFAPAAAAVFIATWAVGGYYQSFGPSVALEDLHSTDALVSAAVFASYLGPTVLGGLLAGSLRPATAQRIGMTVLVAATAALVVAIAAGNAVGFIAAGVAGGIGQGVAAAGTMRALLPAAAPHERAGVLSLVYATSYTGAAVPSLIAGQLSRTVSLQEITAGYLGLAGSALVVTVVTARNPLRSEPS